MEKAMVPEHWHDGPVHQRRVELFVRMWSVAHLVHLCAATGGALASVHALAVCVAALWLIWRPRSTWALVAMSLAQLIDYALGLPVSPDHWFLIGVGNLVILLSLAVDRLRRRPSLVSALPGLRLVLLVGYSCAALAKYNVDFLHPVSSCATAIAHRASFGLTDHLPPIWGVASVIVESLIPVMLAVPRTRRHGVRLGLAFHFVLSASPAFAVVDFTAALYALFFLFLPDRDIVRIVARLRWIGQRSAIVRDARRIPPVTIVVALVAFGLSGHVVPPVSRAVVFVGAQVYIVAMLVVALETWRIPARTPVRLGRPQVLHAVPILILLAWAASPYLGLRTAGVLTMFSNLRTEPDFANHLFIPTYPVTDWQADLVVIEESSDAAVDRASSLGIAVPHIQLRQMASADPDLVVVGRRSGTPVAFGPGTDGGRILPLTGWARRYVLFRPITTSGAPFCPNA